MNEHKQEICKSEQKRKASEKCASCSCTRFEKKLLLSKVFLSWKCDYIPLDGATDGKFPDIYKTCKNYISLFYWRDIWIS